MKIRLLAALAAFVMMLGLAPSISSSPTGGLQFTSMTSAAYAAEGKWGERVKLRGASLAQVVDLFLAGDEPCVGSKQNHTCYSYDPFMNSLHIQRVSRPDGVNKNIVSNMDVVLEQKKEGDKLILTFKVTQEGLPMILFQSTSEQQNAAAIWTTAVGNMLPALTNGMGAAGVQAIANPCGNGRCNQQPGVINVVTANAGSSALSSLTSNGACTTCAVPAPKP